MESTKTICRGCALKGVERRGNEINHICKRTGELRPYRVTECKYRK